MRYEAVTYHPHARLRMRRRKVSENQTFRALNDPNARFYENGDKRVCEITIPTGATLRVVFVETTPKTALVITVIRIGN